VVVKIDSDKKLLDDAGVEDVEKFLQFGELFTTLITKSHNMDLMSFVPEVLRDIGMLEDILKGVGKEERLDSVNSLIDEVRIIVESNPNAKLDDFLSYLDTLTKHNLFVKKKRSRVPTDKIRLMTAHRSKGLEFEYVYIVNCYLGHFGGHKNIDRLPMLDSVYDLGSGLSTVEGTNDDDDRRLLYVALTRAKKWVAMTYAKVGLDGREQLPSPFILEIDKNLINEIDTSTYERESKESADILLSKNPQKDNTLADKDFVHGLFIKNGLSVSALNNYLLCPWKYFYRNLVRIPQAPEKYLSYGTAVHASLQRFFDARKDEDVGKDFLIDSYVLALNNQPVAENEYGELLEKGKKSLSGWYDTYEESFERNTLSEFRVNGVLLSPEIRLTGVLDKMEFVDGDIVNVVDYKTGKPKTRNELKGETKNSTGDYYRQLVFYKLLLKYFNEGRYNMQSGTIDFIEPDDTGKYRREVFNIEESEVSALEETINRVADEILNLAFWNKKCDDKDCEFCHLRDMMK
jgi:DNA helicase-2/ATP-dependent DNA helicase PcrA